MSTLPPLIIFDLDGTLTESKQPLTRSMAHLLEKLLEHTNVAIISGGALEQFRKQILARLDADAALEHLYMLPTSGAALYEWRTGQWHKVYEEHISDADALLIKKALENGAEETGLIDFSVPGYGKRIELRGGQVTLSALGQEAPVAEKKAWDGDHTKRAALQAAVTTHLPPGYIATIGGSTSIDVTKAGVDKAYGLSKLAARLGIAESEVLYVGDELRAHGNDEAVFKTGAKTHAVLSPTHTARFIGTLLHTHF